MQARGGGPGELCGGDRLAVGSGGVECVCGVDDETDVVAEVARQAGGGLTADVRLDAANGQCRDLSAPQPAVEVGVPVEGGVHGLGDEQVGIAAHRVLEPEPGRPGRERRVRPVVANEDDRSPALPPGCDQAGDVRLGLGAVARAEDGVLEAALHVDHHKG